MNTLSERKCIVILSLLVVFHLVNNIIWLKIDTTPPGWDQANHLNLSIDYLNWLKEDIFNFKSDFAVKFLNISYRYPPFYHLTLVPIHLIFGINEDYPVLINIAYLAIVLFSIYGIGKILYSKAVGLMSAFLFSMYQIWILMTRNCLIEAALTAFVVLSYYLFLKSDSFNNRKYSILLGLASGIGMLAKWSFLFFVSGIIVLTVATLVKTKFKNLLNIALSFLSAFILIFPWYGWNAINMITGYSYNMNLSVVEGIPDVFTFYSLAYYLKSIIVQIQPVFFLLFIFSLALSLIYCNKKQNIPLILFLCSYLILVLVRNKEIRFSIPFLPLVAIVSVSWIDLIKDKIKNNLYYFIVVFGIFQFIAYSYLPYNKILSGISTFNPPDSKDWHYSEFFEYLLENDGQKRGFLTLKVASDNERFNSFSFKFWIMKNKLPVIVRNVEEEATEFSDFVIYKTGNQCPSWKDMKNLSKIYNTESDFYKIFKKVVSYDLPDGSMGTLYKRDPDEFKQFDSLNEVKLKIVSALNSYFQRLENPKVTIKEYTRIESRKGHFKLVEINAEKLIYNGLVINDLSFILRDVSLNIYELFNNRKILILGLKEFEPKLKISKGSIIDFINKKSGPLENLQISFKDNNFGISGRYAVSRSIKMPVEIIGDVSLDLERKEYGVDINRISLFRYVVIPRYFYLNFFTKKPSLEPAWNWPVRTIIRGIKLQNSMLEIL